MGTPASGDELYDSGWATSATDRSARSVLGPSDVPVDRLLPKESLRKLQLPTLPGKTESGLKWRPARTAQRPGPMGTPRVYPPLPADAKGRADAPRTATPGETAKEEASTADRRPAPFVAGDVQPLAGGKPDQQEPQGGSQQHARPQQPGTQPETPVEPPQGLTGPARSAPERAEPQTERAPQADDAAPRDAAPADEAPQRESASGPRQSAPPKAREAERDTKPQSTPEKPEKLAAPARELAPLTRNQQNLRRRLRSVLSFYYRRPLNSVDHDAWEVMHSMLSYGLYSRVQDGGRRGRPVTAVGYLCFNKPCQRRTMFYITADGQLDVRVGVGLQGHKGQLLAMLAQCNVSPDYPIRVDGQDFTIRDLIKAEQRTCYARSELSFKLIGLMHYLPSDTTWVNDQGEAWDIPKLIADERTQKIRGAACGGTHRLAGLTLAYQKRLARDEPLDGEWAEAKDFVDQYRNYAFRLQNRDGSLSTEWFRGPGAEDSIDRRVRTTGHLLEWLLYSCDDEQLSNPQIFRAVNYLTNLLASNTSNGWEIGPLSHALHALLIYDQRVFVPHDDDASAQVAQRRRGQQSGPLNYRQLQSSIRESYANVQDRHEERLERENSGLGALFGIGRSSNRRSR